MDKRIIASDFENYSDGYTLTFKTTFGFDLEGGLWTCIKGNGTNGLCAGINTTSNEVTANIKALFGNIIC